MIPLSPAQRQAGAVKSKAARQARADLKKALNRGFIDFDQLLTAPEAKEMRVVDALTALPQVGPARAEKMMREARISKTRRVGGLGVNQQAALRAILHL